MWCNRTDCNGFYGFSAAHGSSFEFNLQILFEKSNFPKGILNGSLNFVL
jgi:hypothetical protein